MNAVVSTLDARRAKALESFRAKGLPHRRVEEWKYSDLRALIAANDVEQAGAAQWSIELLTDGIELFDLSKNDVPDWLGQRLGSLSEPNAMESASLGLARSGFALRVPEKVGGEVRVRWLSAGQARVLIVMEERSSLNFLEEVLAFSGFQNVGAEIFLGARARLSQVRIAPRNSEAVQVSETTIRLGKGASYRAHFANFGAKLSRTEVHISLEGEGAQAHLSGVSVLGDGAHADITTHVSHAVGNTQSRQLFKKVARGKSRGIYQGKVTVAQGADGSDSLQSAKGLLLSERAEIDLKPELEIFADDVKCAHGAAVGDLDLESLFYLQSRGIPEGEARSLLIRAFLGDAIEEVENEDIRATIWNTVDAALETML